jgi:hypothetical protein
MPVPDPLGSRVDHRSELTFEQGRDLAAFATTLLTVVGDFVDGMLDVLAGWGSTRRCPE